MREQKVARGLQTCMFLATDQGMATTLDVHCFAAPVKAVNQLNITYYLHVM